jgi:hypothetical protein
MTRKERLLRMIFPGLLVLAGAVTILCLVSLLRGGEPAREAKRLLHKFQYVPPASEKDKTPDPREKFLSDRNIFAGPKKPWQAQLVGVLGDLAFFENGPGLKVGETHNGAKITKIGPDWVELDIDGKTQKVQVFTGGPSAGGPSPGGPPPGVVMRSGPMPSGPPGDFKVSPEMIERFKQLPPEVREKAMQNMPPNIREQLMKAM